MSGKRVSDWLIYSEHFVGDGPAVYAGACEAGLEGIISKRADLKYRSGRFKDWLKIKCHHGEEFVIGGYSRSDVKGKPFSSLLLGSSRTATLKFAGKVGTGFDSAMMTMLAKRFKPLERGTSPFDRGSCHRTQGRKMAGTETGLRGQFRGKDQRWPLAPSELSGFARG